MLAAVAAFALDYWYLLLPSLIVLHLIRNRYHNGLHKYPGPFLASITNLDRFFDALGRQIHLRHIQLHRKYGPIVRIGPNLLSFSSPHAIKDIYGLNKGFSKTEFYPVQSNVSQGHVIESLFTMRDETAHATLRRAVNAAFSMSTLVAFEPLVDSTTSVFLAQTRKLFSSSGKTVDFAQWLQYYAFDVIGTMAVSSRFGFLERNEDVSGIIAAIAHILYYSGPVGQLPWLDTTIGRKNPIVMLLRRLGITNPSNAVTNFSQKFIAARKAASKTGKLEVPENTHDSVRGTDFLTRFTLAQQAHPDIMTDEKVLVMLNSLVNAGSDTTAISLSSVFYHLLRHPRVYRKLMEELDKAAEAGVLPPRTNTDAVVSYSAAQSLPYLDAVIQESFRIFPAAGLPLERYVPTQGAIICGEAIPGGTAVGVNAWVVHRSEEVFGGDVDNFRPERWIEAGENQKREMKATMFQFGAGSRTCIGKNISLLEIYKLVPTFLRAFEIEWAEPGADWKAEMCWFVKQHDFNVRVRERSVTPAAQ